MKHGYIVEFSMMTTESSSTMAEEGYMGSWSHSMDGYPLFAYPVETRPDVLSFDEIMPDEEAWLVYGIYSTGDSFGNSCGNVSPIALFKETDHQFAETVKRHIEAHREMSRPPGIELAPDKTYRWPSVEWGGYFETLERVEITKIPVKANHAYPEPKRR